MLAYAGRAQCDEARVSGSADIWHRAVERFPGWPRLCDGSKQQACTGRTHTLPRVLDRDARDSLAPSDCFLPRLPYSQLIDTECLDPRRDCSRICFSR